MSIESALALIESVKDYRVLFVGDAIQDEYHYCRPLGKSPKEHLIPVAFIESEVFEGGTQAAANHAKTFCKTVDVCKSPTAVRKVRYIDHYFRKLFEVQYDPLITRNSFLDGDYDAVIVTDFGHDRVTGAMVARLTQKPYLAVAAQTNSSNIGYNLITKYPRADYIVIDEPEARLAAADRDSHIQDVIERLAHGRCNKFIVTHGHHGAYGYADGKHYHSPALSKHPLDTMGAGDAFFAVTAPMAKTGHIEDLLLIGNAAGALKTQIRGHRESLTKEKLIEFIRAR